MVYPENDTCKITLVFNASRAGNYRLTFAVDARVRNYVNRTGEHQYDLDFDDYSIVFDWSDVIAISGLQVTHGMTVVDGSDYFWFRMRRDNVPKGAHVVIDPTVIFSTVSVTSVHTCPLDTHTFVVVYSDDTNDDFSFQIWDTNGTQVLAETDVDTTSGGDLLCTSIGVSAFNSTTFVVGWHDKTDLDATFAIYNTAGSLLSGPTDADTSVSSESFSVQVSCLNSTHFVIGWYDSDEYDTTFAVYEAGNATAKTGPIDADTNSGTYSYSVSVSAFNSTVFVVGWYDSAEGDATFAVYYSNGTQIGATVDVDDAVSVSVSVSVSALNSTHFVIGWFDRVDEDATFAVYTSAGALVTGPTDADTAVGTGCNSVQVSALNSTAFAMSWYDYVDYDLSFATYLSNGTAVAALTYIESWPTAANAPLRYQSPCSQESGTGIRLYGDNWVIAYANTTTKAIWKAFTPAGAAWDGTIPSAGIQYTVSLSHSISVSWAITHHWIAHSALSQAIGTAWSVLNHWTAHIGLSQPITVTWDALNHWTANVGLSQSVSSTWNVLMWWSVIIGLSQAISSSWNVATMWAASIGLSQGITSAWGATLKWAANVDLAQTIVTSLSITVQHGLVVGLAQAVGTSWNVATRWVANIGLAQAFSSSWNALSKWSANIGLAQAIGSAWSVLNHWVASADLAQGIGMSWSVLSRWSANIGLTQSISNVWNAATSWVARMGMTQGISSTWNAVTQATYNIGVSLSATTGWGVDALRNLAYAFFVDLSQAIGASWNVATRWYGELPRAGGGAIIDLGVAVLGVGFGLCLYIIIRKRKQPSASAPLS